MEKEENSEKLEENRSTNSHKNEPNIMYGSVLRLQLYLHCFLFLRIFKKNFALFCLSHLDYYLPSSCVVHLVHLLFKKNYWANRNHFGM